MKKFLFAIAAIFSLALASCEKEESIETQNSFDTLNATIESAAQTKAELSPGAQPSDDVQVKWSEDDAISVFFKTGTQTVNVKYILQNGSGTTTGTFAKSDNTDLTNATFLAAVYPYQEQALYDENTKTVSQLVLDDEYTYNSSKIVTTAPMAYTGNVNAISFKNAAALVRITTSNIPNGYDKIILSSNSKSLAGNYKIQFNNSNEPIAEMESTATDTEIVYEGISTNQTLFFPVIPGEYTDLTVKAYDMSASKVMELVPTRALNAVRNNVYYTGASYIEATNNIQNLNSNLAGETINVDFSNISGDIEINGDNLQSSKINIYDQVNRNNFEINCPNSTVNISGSAIYTTITAKTADNTLILSGGVTVSKLIVQKGNVQVNAGTTLNSIELDGITSVIVIDNGGNISNDVKNESGVTIISALEADIEAAQPGETVYLTNNVKLSETLIVKKSITLDLNNYTISPADNFEYFEGDAEFFTMILVDAKESSEDIVVTIKNGTLNGGTDKVSRVLYGEGGYIFGSLYGNKRQNLTLNVENLKINHANTNGKGSAMTAGGGYFNLDNKTEIITSGTYGTIECSADGVLNINGATITHNDSKPSPSVGFALGASFGGTINITSGNISSDRHCLYALPSSGILNVTGGTFNGNLVEDHSQGKNVQINISAGTFSVDPTDYLIDGSTVQQSGTTWIVTNN